ncbi:MAG: hypothetical protein IKR48_13425 [Kiritimatiellae bacterium]|nr:hypothetical protein [Kiritimatiellia bacterium]
MKDLTGRNDCLSGTTTRTTATAGSSGHRAGARNRLAREAERWQNSSRQMETERTEYGWNMADGTDPLSDESRAEWICGGGYLIDNRDGLLTTHVHMCDTMRDGSPGGGNVAGGLEARILLPDARLVPDYDRDGAIDATDETSVRDDKTFRFWVNDDEDKGNCTSGGKGDIPGTDTKETNWKNGSVDGKRDLLDLFPLWADLSGALAMLDGIEGVKYMIRVKGVKVAYTDLTRQHSGDYLKQPVGGCGLVKNQSAESVSLYPFFAAPSEWGDCRFVPSRLGDYLSDPDKGVILTECTSPDAEVWLEIRMNNTVFYSAKLPLSASSVEDMYRWVNLRHLLGEAEIDATDADNITKALDGEYDGTDIFLIHGFNVSEVEARGWCSEMFKRFYQTGSKSKIWGITWTGDMGTVNASYYHEDVTNAFFVAGEFASYLNLHGGDKKTVIAHSLGNMVVSSAIQDHGLIVSNYFMCNAAVATEAYNAERFNTGSDNLMVHNAWKRYNPHCYASWWHKLFESDPDDDRKNLTWVNRFSSVKDKTKLVNLFSSGDEVLELDGEGNVWLTEGIIGGGFGHYAWHKQEIHKGRGGVLTGTNWAGWGFGNPCFYRQVMQDGHIITVAVPYYPDSDSTFNCDEQQFKEHPVFLNYPGILFQRTMSPADRNELLAKGIPALSPPAGGAAIGLRLGIAEYDLNSQDFRRNGWGRTDFFSWNYSNRWLHGDMTDMAYFYVYRLFELFEREKAK